MSTITIPNSPVHSDSILTAVYGETGQYWARFHTGTDFAPYGDTPSSPPLFSVCTGVVASVTYTSVLGNQIIIKDDITGNYWRYCHMKEASPLSVGQQVNTGTQVGVMGETGSGAHGVHLHLEYSSTIAWDYDTFLNPSIALGIPNERGTIVKYDGSAPPPIPPTPPTPTEDKINKWYMMYNKKINIII